MPNVKIKGLLIALALFLLVFITAWKQPINTKKLARHQIFKLYKQPLNARDIKWKAKSSFNNTSQLNLNINRSNQPEITDARVKQILDAFQFSNVDKKLLSTNSTGMFRYLLKYSMKSGYAGHVFNITSVLLHANAITTSEFSDALSCVCEERSFGDGLILLDKAISQDIDLTIHIFAPLLKSCGTARNARKIFQRMEFFGFSPNVISFTTAIKSCETYGHWEDSLEIFSLMKSVGVQPNERTYACLISAASRGLAADVAINVLNEMTLNDFPPNMICYGGALTACARCDMWEEVDSLLGQMLHYNMILNQSVLSSVINVCRLPPASLPVPMSEGRTSTQQNIDNQKNIDSSSSSSSAAAVTEDIDILDELYSNDNDDSTLTVELMRTGKTTSTLSTGTSNSKYTTNTGRPEVRWERALHLFDTWVDHIYGRNESLFTLVMGVCEAGERFKEVVHVYKKMLYYGISPTRNSCRFALRACYAGNLPVEAIEILQDAEQVGATKSGMYSDVVTICERTGRYDCAITLLEWMLRNRNSGVSVIQMRRVISTALQLMYRTTNPSTSKQDYISENNVNTNIGKSSDTNKSISSPTTPSTTNSNNITINQISHSMYSSESTESKENPFHHISPHMYTNTTALYSTPTNHIPSKMMMASLIHHLITSNLTSTIAYDTYRLACTVLLENHRYTPLRYLLKDCLSVPAFQYNHSSSSYMSTAFVSSRVDRNLKLLKTSLYVDMIGALLSNITRIAYKYISYEKYILHPMPGLFLTNTALTSSSITTTSSSTVTTTTTTTTTTTSAAAAAGTIESMIQFVLLLMKDLCALGQTRKIYDIFLKWLYYYSAYQKNVYRDMENNIKNYEMKLNDIIHKNSTIKTNKNKLNHTPDSNNHTLSHTHHNTSQVHVHNETTTSSSTTTATTTAATTITTGMKSISVTNNTKYKTIGKGKNAILMIEDTVSLSSNKNKYVSKLQFTTDRQSVVKGKLLAPILSLVTKLPNTTISSTNISDTNTGSNSTISNDYTNYTNDGYTSSSSSSNSNTSDSSQNRYRHRQESQNKSNSYYYYSASQDDEDEYENQLLLKSDYEQIIKKLQLELQNTRRFHTMIIHTLFTEVRLMLQSHMYPTPLPLGLYKNIADMYTLANVPEIMSEMYKQATEDNVIDKNLRNTVIQALSASNMNNMKVTSSSSSPSSSSTTTSTTSTIFSVGGQSSSHTEKSQYSINKSKYYRKRH